MIRAALSLVGCAAVVAHAARIIRKDGHLLQHTALVVVLAAINFCEATCFALGRAFMARDDDGVKTALQEGLVRVLESVDDLPSATNASKATSKALREAVTPMGYPAWAEAVASGDVAWGKRQDELQDSQTELEVEERNITERPKNSTPPENTTALQRNASRPMDINTTALEMLVASPAKQTEPEVDPTDDNSFFNGVRARPGQCQRQHERGCGCGCWCGGSSHGRAQGRRRLRLPRRRRAGRGAPR